MNRVFNQLVLQLMRLIYISGLLIISLLELHSGDSRPALKIPKVCYKQIQQLDSKDLLLLSSARMTMQRGTEWSVVSFRTKRNEVTNGGGIVAFADFG